MFILMPVGISDAHGHSVSVDISYVHSHSVCV